MSVLPSPCVCVCVLLERVKLARHRCCWSLGQLIDQQRLCSNVQPSMEAEERRGRSKPPWPFGLSQADFCSFQELGHNL